MLRRLALFAATAALAVVAFLARDGADDGAAGPPADAESAYRLRLVELTLAAGRAPRRDRFLAPPEGRVVPWPPLYHAALARLARARLARPGGDPALRGVDAAALRRWLRPASPLGFAAAVLVAAAAAAVLASDGRAPRGGGAGGPLPRACAASIGPRERAAATARAALVAAAVVALHPAALERGLAARVAPDGWALAAGAGVVLAALGALRPGDRIDGLSFALGGGLLAGLAALLSPAALGAALAAVAALVVVDGAADPARGASIRAGARGDERAADARRSAVLFCVTAGVACGVARWSAAPALDGGEGRSAEAGLSAFFLLLAVPPLVFGFLRVDRLGLVPRALAAVLAVAVLAGPLGVLGWLEAERARLEPWSPPSAAATAGGAWTLASLAALPLAVAAAWRGLDPPRRALLATAALFGAGEAVLGPGAGPAFLLALALALGCAAAGARAARGLALALAVGSVAAGLWRVLPVSSVSNGERAGPEETAARARESALAWLRTATPPPGPWNSARAVPAWSVAAPPEWDGWIAGVARRAAVDARLAPGAGPALWPRLGSADAGELVQALDARGARYLVVPGDARPEPGSALARLANGEAVAGLELAWSSSLPAGDPANPGGAPPAVAIWRRSADAPGRIDRIRSNPR